MKRLFAVAACAALIGATPMPGRASLWIGYVTESASGRVIMNLFGLNGLSWDMRFRPVHEVEALDVARRDLVRRGRIRDLPVLVVGPWLERRNRLSVESRCEVAYGDAAAESNRDPLGPCYRIEIAEHYGTASQLALLLALPRLSSGTGAIEVGDLAAFRTAQAASFNPYQNLLLHFDPIWSPDGSRLLRTVWQGGRVRLEVVDAASGNVTSLETLEEYPVIRPIWSGDSRFVAYADLTAVKVYDTRTRSTRTFRPTDRACMETLLWYEGTTLHFAFDTACWNDYELYAYDTVRRELRRLPALGALRDSGPQRDLDRHASLDPVRSPNGRWVAVFAFVSGQRRIAVKALR